MKTNKKENIVWRKIISRRRKKNQMKISVKLTKKQDVKTVEKEIKRAIRKLNRSLDEGISFEAKIMSDSDNFLEE